MNKILTLAFILLTFSAIPASAALTYVGNCTGASSCSTTNSTGDLEIAYAGRNGSSGSTAPSLPAGWTNVGTASINGTGSADSSVRMACKVATGSNEASGTFTNADQLTIHVYSGQRGGTTATCASAILGTPSFFTTTVDTTSTTETFNSITNGDSSSWVAGFGYCSACTAGIDTAPTGMSNRSSRTAPPSIGGHDTNGGVSSWTTADVTLTTAGRIITGTVEIKAPVTRYWVGGSGSFSQTTHWSTSSGGSSGASVPTTTDTATWDSSSASGNYTATIDGSPTVATFTYNGRTEILDVITLSGSLTVTGTLTINGNSATNRLYINSSVPGTARTITAATVSATNVDFQDITGAGAGSWDLSAITGKSGDCGGNTSITFTTGATQTFSGTVSDSWSTNAWTSRVPLCQDDVVISSAFSSAQTVTGDMPRLGKSIDFSGASWSGTALNWTLTSGLAPSVFGSITMKSGMTMTHASSGLTVEARSNASITSNGITFVSGTTINMPGATFSLADNLTAPTSSAGVWTVNYGGLDFNGKNFTGGGVASTGSTTRSVTCGTGTLDIGATSTVWNFATTTNLTFSCASATIIVSNTSATAKTFAGGGLTYGTVTFSGDNITVTGANTFATLNVNTAGRTTGLLLTNGVTQTITATFATNGTGGNLAKMWSSSAGSAATVSKSSGTVCVDFMSLKDSTATGGATWYAGTGSSNVSGNTGWNFLACPAASALVNVSGGWLN